MNSGTAFAIFLSTLAIAGVGFSMWIEHVRQPATGNSITTKPPANPAIRARY